MACVKQLALLFLVNFQGNWQFIPQAGNLSSYIIANGVGNGDAAFVLYPAVGNPGPLNTLFAQAATQLTQSQALVFEYEPFLMIFNSFSIKETTGGNVLTAWPTKDGSDIRNFHRASGTNLDVRRGLKHTSQQFNLPLVCEEVQTMKKPDGERIYKSPETFIGTVPFGEFTVNSNGLCYADGTPFPDQFPRECAAPNVNTYGPSANNPVIGQAMNAAPSLNQQWSFLPPGVFNESTDYFIVNGVSGGNGTFLSYPGAGTLGPLRLVFPQAVTQLSKREALIYEVECSSTVSNVGIIKETYGGNVLTAWPTEEASTITPVTYVVFTGRPEQT
ncbi:hypothetical protein C8R44DRAFT_749470 [Mycena epipterygia]|nr:hypothetical protein C8R44DRAFT_749470 [Mycena epipterygia]